MFMASDGLDAVGVAAAEAVNKLVAAAPWVLDAYIRSAWVAGAMQLTVGFVLAVVAAAAARTAFRKVDDNNTPAEDAETWFVTGVVATVACIVSFCVGAGGVHKLLCPEAHAIGAIVNALRGGCL